MLYQPYLTYDESIAAVQRKAGRNTKLAELRRRDSILQADRDFKQRCEDIEREAQQGMIDALDQSKARAKRWQDWKREN